MVHVYQNGGHISDHYLLDHYYLWDPRQVNERSTRLIMGHAQSRHVAITALKDVAPSDDLVPFHAFDVPIATPMAGKS